MRESTLARSTAKRNMSDLMGIVVVVDVLVRAPFPRWENTLVELLGGRQSNPIEMRRTMKL